MNMVNKKTIVAGLLIVFAIMAVVVVAYTKNPTVVQDVAIPNAKAPPSTSEEIVSQTLKLSDVIDSTGGADGVTCQQPPKDNEYGGISGKENISPIGTVIDPDLTKQYGKPTATGVCGTYWYIVGWWFNASEMAKLPSETILYGVSPYAITRGGSDGEERPGTGTQSGTDNEESDDGDSDNGIDGDDSGDDNPVMPVPEIATVLLVAFGIFMFTAWKKVRK